MEVALQGSSAATVTAGILLLSRSRRLGQRIEVQVVGDPSDIAEVKGPAIVHSPVLAGCGVGRELGSGPLVIVPGPATDSLAISLEDGGADHWFLVDRAGGGSHPATQAFVRLCRDRQTDARTLGRQLRGALSALGCTPEPALLDLLFGSPVSPLERLSLGLRAGRAMTGSQGAPLTRILGGHAEDMPDPLPTECTEAQLQEAISNGHLEALLDRLAIGVRDSVDDWMAGMGALETESRSKVTPLLCALAEVGSHLITLPRSGMLPPLNSAMDSVAVGLGSALGATRGEMDANATLTEMFCFLGGRFVPEAGYPIQVPGDAPTSDRLERWKWLCQSVSTAAETAETLWRQVVDPPQ